MNGQIVAVDILNNRRADSDCWLQQAVAYISTADGETAVAIEPAQYDALNEGIALYREGAYVALANPVRWADVFGEDRGM